jgi:hypothetical protein
VRPPSQKTSSIPINGNKMIHNKHCPFVAEPAPTRRQTLPRKETERKNQIKTGQQGRKKKERKNRYKRKPKYNTGIE